MSFILFQGSHVPQRSTNGMVPALFGPDTSGLFYFGPDTLGSPSVLFCSRRCIVSKIKSGQTKIVVPVSSKRVSNSTKPGLVLSVLLQILQTIGS